MSAPSHGQASAIVGCLLGTAVGDAMGLPYEGLSRRRAQRMLGMPTRYRFLLGRGMVSDDTEHTCLVAQALVESRGDETRFLSRLARGLRVWMLLLPAGIGWATLRACVRLWLGVSPARSGVRSAGNGPAMRSAIIGAAIREHHRLGALVRLSTRLTHSDERAEHGALSVALAAAMAAAGGEVSGDDYLTELRALLPREGSAELLEALARAARSAAAGESTAAFADSMGLEKGVSGYVNHSVPVAIQAWLLHQRDLVRAVAGVVQCGGDTDTTAAITGGIVGARVGKAGIPQQWLTGLLEWPRSVAWLQHLGESLQDALHGAGSATPPRLPLSGLLLRNGLFVIVVLAHGFRRLLPPY